MTSLRVEAKRLQHMLLAARERTLAFAADLSGAQLLGPRLAIVNPPLWEIGHMGWFQERWCLRRRADGQLAPSILDGADRLYDSSAVAHDTRWDLPLPSLEATRAYLETILERVSERLAADADEALLYFAELAALHEEMHAEAFTYTRQTLAYQAPKCERLAAKSALGSSVMRETSKSAPGDVAVDGGEFLLGAMPHDGFVFDNEKWAHPISVAPFAIARTAVTNSEFAAFVDDRGYARRELWCADGWAWRTAAAAEQPVYWQRVRGAWFERCYDERLPLAPSVPVMHVNWYEANAYCRWAARRLPTEAEWEYAAATEPNARAGKRRYPWGEKSAETRHANLFGAANGRIAVDALAAGDSAWGVRQLIGNVWEWTADDFAPYPGFIADPYKEYSQPWFGYHKVLRGGSHATRAVLIRNTWRNFYTPDRRDVFAGFRTCAR